MACNGCSGLTIALIGAGLLSCGPAAAVRINADGHGQALIYPYYTARSTVSGNALVTAVSVSNITAQPKALKVRILEAKAGAEVFGFNLFLDAYDMWTGGIVATGAGAGLFTQDTSCTSPAIGRTSAAPSPFSAAAYAGDLLGEGPDRTLEGYIEILEMAVIDSGPLVQAVTHVSDLTSPNASKPPCTNLPVTDAAPAGLSRPTGGLLGNVSYLNINEGTDYSVDATALAQWSNRVQWSGPGNAHPNLADTFPPVSFVADSTAGGDAGYLTTWTSGRDAISALFVADQLINDFAIEAAVKGATDWVLSLPTKRFYVDRLHAESPFEPRAIAATTAQYACQPLGAQNFCDGTAFPIADREGQRYDFQSSYTCTPTFTNLCAAVGGLRFGMYGGAPIPNRGSVLPMQSVFVQPTDVVPGFPSTGWLEMRTAAPGSGQSPAGPLLAAPHGATTIVNARTGAVTTGATVTYHGLPIIGFAVQSYNTTGLPGVSAGVLSNYGGQFNHKVRRRIEVAP